MVQFGQIKMIEELQSLEFQQETWNHPERRMEEWGAHSLAGAGAESYFDDLNYVNGNISGRRGTLSDILTWLSENCPLLWAKWEENQLVAN